MNRALFLTALVVITGLVFTGCTSPDEGTVELNRTELDSFLGTEESFETGSFLEGGVALEAAEKGITPTDAELITEALADSFKMKAEDIQVTVERDSTADYATGYVNVGEGDEGGIYFAAKIDGEWEIAHNGTGIIECQQIEDYDFPVGLIPRCFDQTTGQNIDR